MKPNNPFLISGYHSPEFFCNRESEKNRMIEALYNARNITLISPRRMGKTGLIRHLFYNLKKENSDIVTFYMDIFSTQSLSDFITLFANTVLGQLDTIPQKAMSRVSSFIKSCRPVMTFDEFNGMPKFVVDIIPATEEVTLKEIFDYLASSEKQCYIAIDEFQQITEYPEKGVEALLRSYIQFLPNVNFIFSGSKKHIMQEMFTSANKPFYQSTQLLNIGAIDIEDYANFAIRHFSNAGKNLTTEMFHKIYHKFEGHTWYIQSVLNRLYGYSSVIDKSTIDYAINQIISEFEYTYNDLLKAYPKTSVSLLKAVAREGCVKELFNGDFISKHKLRAASSVSYSLKKLIDKELLYESDNGYIVYDRFMAEWLRQQPF